MKYPFQQKPGMSGLYYFILLNTKHSVFSACFSYPITALGFFFFAAFKGKGFFI